MKCNFKCPECNHIVNKGINTVTQYGIGCPVCSDGFSYPEKFMFELLRQLNLEFETQKSFSWSKRKRYDFYVPSINLIIETHGLQHYKGMKFKNKKEVTLKKQIENDHLKRTLAKNNGIGTYVEINCCQSNMTYIKKSIMESNLSKILDLKIIDWQLCALKANQSIIIEVVKLWNEQNTTSEICGITKISLSSTLKYLRKGEEAGLCVFELNKKFK